MFYKISWLKENFSSYLSEWSFYFPGGRSGDRDSRREETGVVGFGNRKTHSSVASGPTPDQTKRYRGKEKSSGVV